VGRLGALCSLFRVACKQWSADVTIFEKWYSNAVATKQPKICCAQQLDKGSDCEEKERLHDLDNYVPRAA
jgi:hypothetical protein